MQVEIPYAGASVPIEIPDDRFLGVLRARMDGAVCGPGAVAAAAASPLGGPALAGFAGSGEPVLVLVNDATRPTPTALMLDELWPVIGGWDLSFLVATGTHAGPNDAGLAQIFGKFWPDVKNRVFLHDARDAGGLLPVGVTAAGTEVLLNRRAVEAAKILVLSSVESHYFAGYTGGRKIVLPGISAYSTIEQNHRLAMLDGAEALRLDGNPVHADMDEALSLLMAGRAVFGVLGVLDPAHWLAFVAAGDVQAAFLEAAAVVDEMFAVPLAERADVVVAVNTPPLDVNFYQAQKAVENGIRAVRPGGTLIVVSACHDGAGSNSFLKLMRAGGSPQRTVALAHEDYRLGHHKAARLSNAALHCRLWSVTGVDAEVARTAFMEPYDSVDEAVRKALAADPNSRLAVLMDAGVTVPVPGH